jgi:hypothetical protein
MPFEREKTEKQPEPRKFIPSDPKWKLAVYDNDEWDSVTHYTIAAFEIIIDTNGWVTFKPMINARIHSAEVAVVDPSSGTYCEADGTTYENESDFISAMKRRRECRARMNARLKARPKPPQATITKFRPKTEEWQDE